MIFHEFIKIFTGIVILFPFSMRELNTDRPLPLTSGTILTEFIRESSCIPACEEDTDNIWDREGVLGEAYRTGQGIRRTRMKIVDARMDF